MLVTVSAPGKIFLMGEHAVVYGKPALLSCINKRVTVTVRKSSVQTLISSDDPDFINQILRIVKNHYQIKNFPSLHITVSSRIKSGYHLGSSASVSAATVAALLFFLKKIWNLQTVNKLSFEAEKIKHGTPSGADNSAVTFGGFVWFRYELDFLKNIWQIPVKVSEKLDHFYLVDTGKPEESTKEMVSKVAQLYQINRRKFEQLLATNEQATRKIAQALKNEDNQSLINSIKAGQSTLEQMGVVSGKVIPFIRDFEASLGAAKILGGGGQKGGVGYLLCFHPDKEVVKKISSKFAWDLESVTLGQEGLKLEKENE